MILLWLLGLVCLWVLPLPSFLTKFQILWISLVWTFFSKSLGQTFKGHSHKLTCVSPIFIIVIVAFNGSLYNLNVIILAQRGLIGPICKYFTMLFCHPTTPFLKVSIIICCSCPYYVGVGLLSASQGSFTRLLAFSRHQGHLTMFLAAYSLLGGVGVFLLLAFLVTQM